MHVHLVTPIITKDVRKIDDTDFLAGPDLEFSHSILDAGPSSIEGEFDEALAIPDIIVKALDAEKNGADAIVIDCMGDPGLKAIREAVSIPCFGPAETSMHLASMLGHKFSIVTVLDTVRPMLDNLAKIYAVSDKLNSIRVIDIPVLELAERFDETQRKLSAAAVEAVQKDNASVVILGCTGFLGCAEAISDALMRRGLNIPVIDPIPATICIAQATVKAGLTHSKHSYPTPRSKTISGYSITIN